MASNPLLALLNSAGQQSPSAHYDNGGVQQNAGPTSPTASNMAANSLLQSILSPGLSPVTQKTQQPANLPSPAPLSPPAGSNSTAADLLSLLGGGSFGNSKSPQDYRSASEAVRPSSTMYIRSPSERAPSRPTSRTTSIFDAKSPFDILAQAKDDEVEGGRKGSVRRATNAGLEDITRAVSVTIAAETSSWQEEEGLTADRNLRAFRHLAGLRASSAFDDEQTSGVSQWKEGEVENISLDLLAAQPGGVSSLYPAKLEITAISLLKSVQKHTVLLTGQDDHVRARWSSYAVLAAGQGLVCYITGKTKVRIIDEDTGERAVITVDAPVRSLSAYRGTSSDRSALRIGVLTDRTVSVWKLSKSFGQGDDGTECIFSYRSNNVKFAQSSFFHGAERLLVVREDGSVARVDFSSEAKATVSEISEASTPSISLAGVAQAQNSFTLACIHSTLDPGFPIRVTHHAADGNRQPAKDISLPALQDVRIEDVSFSELVGEQTLVLGLNRNTVFAIVDLASAQLQRVYRLNGGKERQYNIVKWHDQSSTLFVFNSLRSSLFTVQPFVKSSGAANRTLLQSNLRPTARECALPEVWLSFDVESAGSDGLRIAAFHAGGVQSLRLPVNAIEQISEQAESAADNTQPLEILSVAKVDEAGPKADDVKSHVSAERIDERLAEAEQRIIASLKTMQLNGANDVGRDGSGNQSELLDKIKQQVQDDVRQGVTAVLAEVLPNELRNVLMRPDIIAHLQQVIANTIVMPVQRTAVDVVTKVLAPHFEDVIGELTRKVEATVDQHMTNVRKDIVAEQSKALLESEAVMRDLAREVGQLTNMMEALSRQNAKLDRALTEVREEQKVLSLNSVRPQSSTAAEAGVPRAKEQYQHAPATPAAQSPAVAASPQPNAEDVLLAALSDPSIEQNVGRLQQTLAQLERTFGSAYRAIRTEQGSIRITQAVNLALTHRLIKSLPLMPLEQAVPWIEACCSACDRSDPQISRVFDGVREDMVKGLIESHQQAVKANRAPWWTGERLYEGSLRFLR